MTWVRNWSLMSTSRVDEKSGKNQQKVAKMARNDSLSWCVKYAEYDFLMSHQLCTRHQSWISSISGVFLHFYGLVKSKCKKLSKKFIKTIVTGNNILYNKLTKADVLTWRKHTPCKQFSPKTTIFPTISKTVCLEIPILPGTTGFTKCVNYVS